MTPGPEIRACVPPAGLVGLEPHAELDIFRPPAEQLEALRELADEARCCVSVAVAAGVAIGYAAFHPPTGIESWGDDRTGRIVELGAVEVAPSWRGHQLGERLLLASLEDGRYDDTVVFATMYAWHYDLARTGLTDFGYKRLLERLYRKAGLEPRPTTDPEIRSNAANGLMVRIGPAAPREVREEFERLRTRPQPLPFG